MCLALRFGRIRKPSEHVRPEFGPLGHPLHGALLSVEDAGDLSELILVPFEVAAALRQQQVQLLLPVLVHGDVLADVGVEPEVGVRRQEGVEHGVNLWEKEERARGG